MRGRTNSTTEDVLSGTGTGTTTTDPNSCRDVSKRATRDKLCSRMSSIYWTQNSLILGIRAFRNVFQVALERKEAAWKVYAVGPKKDNREQSKAKRKEKKSI